MIFLILFVLLCLSLIKDIVFFTINDRIYFVSDDQGTLRDTYILVKVLIILPLFDIIDVVQTYLLDHLVASLIFSGFNSDQVEICVDQVELIFYRTAFSVSIFIALNFFVIPVVVIVRLLETTNEL